MHYPRYFWDIIVHIISIARRNKKDNNNAWTFSTLFESKIDIIGLSPPPFPPLTPIATKTLIIINFYSTKDPPSSISVCYLPISSQLILLLYVRLLATQKTAWLRKKLNVRWFEAIFSVLSDKKVLFYMYLKVKYLIFRLDIIYFIIL